MTDEDSTHFRLKLGAAEIEYKGSADFLKQEIMPTVEKILGMVESRTDLQRSGDPPVVSQPKLSKLPDKEDFEPETLAAHAPKADESTGNNVGSLPSYLKAKNAVGEVKRFLATAAWQHHRGKKELSAPLVSETLRENQQSKLSNASARLNDNVKRGFCEKTKTGFFITPDGWKELGETQ